MLYQFYSSKPYFFYLLLVVGLLIYTYSFFVRQNKFTNLFSLLTAFLTLLFARIPVILKNAQLNPDESMQLAQALSIVRKAAVFDSWDGNTIGPLDTYLIMIPYAFGLPLDYSTLHLLAVCFQFAFFFVCFKAIQMFYNQNTAFVATLPVLIWFVFTQHYDFLHYASELPPILMLASCTWVYLAFLKAKNTKLWLLFVQGALAALIPFAKLQAVPSTFIIIAFTILQLWQSSENRAIFFKKIAYLVVGGLSILFSITTLTLYWGVFDEMILYYFEGNLFHEAGGGKDSIFEKILNHFRSTSDLFELKALVIYLVSITAIALWQKPRLSLKGSGQLLLFTVTLLSFTLFAIGKSGFRLYHYNNFLFLPLILLIAIFVQNLNKKSAKNLLITGVTTLLFLFPILPQIVQGKEFYAYAYTGRKMQVSDVSKAILKYAKAGEPLVVWGWMQDYYVETQMPQGTNDNHAIRCFTYSLVDEHRKRYVADIIKNEPPVIVDAVAPTSFMMKEKELYGLDKFPELQKLINERYVLAETVKGNDIYVIKSRFKK
ncbi:MAG: hypothetical protein ACK4NY_16755 [Spirosomataceae bacterium]